MLKALREERLIEFDWEFMISRVILLTLGAFITALSFNLFFIPVDMAPAGVAGIAVILNELLDTRVGLMITLINIPILLLGARLMSSWRTLIETIYVVFMVSTFTDAIQVFMQPTKLSEDMILNAVFGGIVGGIGVGLVFRAGGTNGGTSTLARILNHRLGWSLSASALYTDVIVMFAGGFVFGWEAALYATLAIFINRMAADYILQGGDSSNTALIVTRESETVRRVLQEKLKRSMTYWEGVGSYHHAAQSVIMLTITRAEVNTLRKIMSLTDPHAFVTILEGHITFGGDFQPLAPSLPLKLDEKDDARAARISQRDIERLKTGDSA